MSDVEMMSEETTGGAVTLNPEASRLFRVYKTTSAMLDKRGYMIPKTMREMTPQDFLQKFGEYPSREALTILVVSSRETSSQPRAHLPPHSLTLVCPPPGKGR